jgi:hypothetical protein
MNTPSKTLKSLLDALAFANVNSLGEFRAMLHQIDDTAHPTHKPVANDMTPATCSNSSFAPAVGHIQGAL